jgi:hypothetical protein
MLPSTASVGLDYRAAMALLDLVTLPVRLTVAAVDTTLALGQLVDRDGPVRRKDGYADRLMLVIGRGGLVDRLTAALSDPHGPMHLVNTVTALLDERRPVGRALAPGGTVDRMLAADGPLFRLVEEGGTVDRILAEGGAVDRLLEEGGALDRLAAVDGPLERLLRSEGALDRVTRPDGLLDRLLVEGGLADRLVSEDGFLEKLVAEGGTLDQLVELGRTLERLQPRVAELLGLIPELHESVDTLNRSVGPIGELANRLPGGRRRPALEG